MSQIYVQYFTDQNNSSSTAAGDCDVLIERCYIEIRVRFLFEVVC